MICKVTYDPNYRHDEIYSLTKLFCLLYDQIYMWYPLEYLAAPYIEVDEMVQLINRKIVIPIGESGWFDKHERRKWPEFAGNWYALDEEIVRTGNYQTFENLLGVE